MRNSGDLIHKCSVFRHGISMIPTSSMAEQYYCEQKVEMEYIHGDVETEATREGRILHQQLIQMKSITRDNLIKSIKKRKLVAASFPIFARFSGLVLAGLPDAVVFVKGVPTYLIELKTTKGDTSRLWKDQLVQVRIYGLILQEMGFDCSRLKLVVVRIRRQSNTTEQYKERFLQEMISNLLKQQAPVAKGGESTTHIIDYSRQDTVANVQWVQTYWLSDRKPIPTSNPAKCKVCEFNRVCPSSLVKIA